MGRLGQVVVVALVALAQSVLGVAAEKAPAAIVEHVQTVLAGWQTDRIIVAAVRAQNAANRSLAEIRQLDTKWLATPGVSDVMRALMDSDCGRRLKQLRGDSKFYPELFVVDRQGANVCMSDKTSDYWQGDEAKFTKAYADGKGALFVDDVKFDASSQSYTVQASLPILDGKTVIGVLTVGIDVEAFENR